MNRVAMNRFVLDCSVTMAWCFEDEADAVADLVLDKMTEAEAWVPTIWPLEVANVLALAERRGRITQADSTHFVRLLNTLPIHIDPDTSVRASGPILALARLYALTAYDAAYLDLALREGISLASRDEKLRAACQKSGVQIIG